MSCLDATRREETIRSLSSRRFDLVVIGGGITGAGILRDACLRGLDVALVEAADFSSGTSSKSTKLIHGGIRYLAMGQVHIVREAARERKRVHHIAPHLAEAKWLTLPSRNRLEWLKYKIGVSAYEWLGQVQKPDLHYDLSGDGLAQHEPLIDRKAFPYASVYREYLTDDSRLVMGNIRAGVRAGGTAVNKMAVTGLLKDHAKVTGVRATCAITGAEALINAKAVINAAGPWVEAVCGFDGLPPQSALTLSKGVHVVVPREKLPLTQMILSVTQDGRPVFFIPRGDVVYIGTTDSQFYGPATLWPEVLAEEIDYLLDPVRRYTGVALGHGDCVSTWAGLRPLISQAGKSTREISRKDEIWISQSGLITIAGGKLTGYRKMAEDTVDVACRAINWKSASNLADEPLPGGDFSGDVSGLAIKVGERRAMPARNAARLARLYGSEAFEVLKLGAESVAPGSSMVAGEIVWAINNESAFTLEDLLYRRTRSIYYTPGDVEAIIEPAAKQMGAALGWSGARIQAECDNVRGLISQDSRPLLQSQDQVVVTSPSSQSTIVSS